MDSAEIVERYVVLLLGSKEGPIPSLTHLQKELFLLSNFKESLKEDFNFEAHYYGPYSQILDDSVKYPFHLKETFSFDNKKIFLSKNGKAEYKHMLEENKSKKEFVEIISSLKLIRELYDQLSYDELLFMVYETYPEYTRLSSISDKLTKDQVIRKKLIESIFSKGIITEERYEELNEGK